MYWHNVWGTMLSLAIFSSSADTVGVQACLKVFALLSSPYYLILVVSSWNVHQWCFEQHTNLNYDSESYRPLWNARVITVGFWSVLTIHVIPKTRIVLVNSSPHLNGWCIRWIYYLLRRILTHLGFLKLNSVHFCQCHWQLCHHCKIFTFLSSPEPLGQFQINFAQNIINLDNAFKLFQWRATFISKGK